MATLAQFTANIANAQLSTGPLSAQGKARSAVNSLKLSLYSEQAVLLSDDDRTAFANLEQSYKSELMAASAIELMLFGLIVLAAFRLRSERSFHKNLTEYRKLKKAEAAESKAEIKIPEKQKNEPNFTAPSRMPNLVQLPKLAAMNFAPAIPPGSSQ